ncbi:CatB-related O-acetyltransferase [Aliarcobacter skirrowii]|uniref:CatB-related O-acetyltransferase n=1 Tax=Aliarcobacter skirrowii TaxID=28200 RepID=UPI000824C45D
MIKNLIIRYIYPINDELFRQKMFNLYGVKIEKNVSIDKKCRNKIGKYTFIGQNAIVGPATSQIGSFCSIAPDVIIGPNSHDIMAITTSTFIHAYSSSLDYRSQKTSSSYNNYKQSLNTKNTAIGHDVWIGYRAIIMPGVTVGDGAIIGAASIVTKDVEPYSIVVGNPAKVIKYRFNTETIQEILNADIYTLDKDKLFNLFVKYKNNDFESNIKEFFQELMELKCLNKI